MEPERRADGLVAYPLGGSRADMERLTIGGSSLRVEADLEPDKGVCAVLLDDPPSSLLLLVDRRTVTSSTTPDFGRP